MSTANFEEDTRDFTSDEIEEFQLHLVGSEGAAQARTPRWLKLAQAAGRALNKGLDGAVYGLGLATGDGDAWDRFASH